MAKKFSQITTEETSALSDTDIFAGEEAGGTTFKHAFSVLKSTLKTYFDTLYSLFNADALASAITLATSKNPPVGADAFPINDTENSNVLKRVTITNLRTFILNAPTIADAANIVQATTSAPGVSELATDTETLTGTATNRTLTPSNLNAVLTRIPRSGQMLNGKISVTVVSNDLVLALKTKADADPAAGDPVYININGTVRTVTAATSCTLADATNWFNSGGAELAAISVDYFAYAIWDSNSSIVAVAPARIPWGRLVSDFSGTSSNEKFLGNHANYTSTDDVCVIGRFAATLSAAAGHVWTVPAFTNANLVQEPIFETRWSDWTPAYSASGSLTYTSVTTLAARYLIREKTIEIVLSATGTLGGSASTRIGFTLPFEGEQSGIATPPIIGSGWNGNANTMCVCFLTPATPDRGDLFNYNLGNWATSGTATIRATGIYEAD